MATGAGMEERIQLCLIDTKLQMGKIISGDRQWDNKLYASNG